MDRTSAYALVILIAGIVAWFVPFPLRGWSRTAPQTRDPKWRWGLLLEVLAYAVAGAGGLRTDALPGWRLAMAAIFMVLASVLSWTSTRSLGRHLRFEAALDADHQLVRSGPYRIIRHPIYASMLCLLLGIAFIAAPPLLFAIALALFLAGTEIRVRVEDRLLADRFGEEFRAYRQSTAAYIPLLR
jgi:protein-S-isoprenylcysteine O-methyltransferase Ste14